MASKDDVRAMFKAARAQKAGSIASLTKDQLRALKAQKAAAQQAAQQQAAEQQAAAQQAAQQRQQVVAQLSTPASQDNAAAAAAMPPPPPRPPAGAMPPPPPRKVVKIKPGLGPTAQARQQAAVAPKEPTAAATVAASVPAGLPSDFFSQYDNVEDEEPAALAPVLPATATPAVVPAAAVVPPKGSVHALPKGFFEDADSDAKARGEEAPSKRDPQKEMDAFLSDIQGELDGAAAVEEVAQAEAAEERAVIEEIAHLQRRIRVEGLKDAAEQRARRVAAPPEAREKGGAAARRRAMLDAVLAGGGEEGSDDDDEEEEDVDWRAKKL